jgi:hypothetical protein
LSSRPSASAGKLGRAAVDDAPGMLQDVFYSPDRAEASEVHRPASGAEAACRPASDERREWPPAREPRREDEEWILGSVPDKEERPWASPQDPFQPGGRKIPSRSGAERSRPRTSAIGEEGRFRSAGQQVWSLTNPVDGVAGNSSSGPYG